MRIVVWGALAAAFAGWGLVASGGTLKVQVRSNVSQQVVNRKVTLTLTEAGPVTAGPWLIAGDWVSQFTDTNGLTYFSNVLAGQYRLDIAGTPSRSFPLGMPDTNGLIDAAALIGTTNSVPLFYTAAQIDGIISSNNAVAAGANIVTGTNGRITTVSLGTNATPFVSSGQAWKVQRDDNAGSSGTVLSAGYDGSLTGRNSFWGIGTAGDFFFAASAISGSVSGLFAPAFTAVSGLFTGNGGGLTNLNATQLTSGTVPDARFPATLPAASGVNLTALNASQLTSGTVPDARNGHPNVFNTNSVGANGVLNAPIGQSAYSNSFVKLFSPQAGGSGNDMTTAPAANYVGQLGLDWAGFKEMNVWIAGRSGNGGSNDWDWSDLNFRQGIHQIGDPRIMPSSVPTTSGMQIYFNGNAEYSRAIYARTNSGARNASYLTLNNMNPFTDGSGISIPMYGTNFGGLSSVLTNNDGAVIYPWDQFGLTILSIPGTYTVGETNMAGSYDIITGVGNSIPLYICCNAQVGNEPVLGQKAWVAFDNRYLANSTLPAATHFQMWRPNVYAFTNANNVDVFMVEHSPEHARIEVETNAYFIHTQQFFVTNRGEMMALATGPYIDITKGACLNTGTNVIFTWDSAHDNSKGCTWSFDSSGVYRFAVEQKNGQFPKLVHGSGAPFAIARSSASDLQTDQSAQTLTDELSIDSSGNTTFSGNLAVAGTSYFAGATTHSNNVTVDAAHALTANSTTQTAGDNSTKLATTAYVDQEGGWVISKVAGSDATTTGQTLVDVTGLTFAAAASTRYEFEAVLECTTSAVTTGTEYGIQYSGTGSPTVQATITGSLTTTTAAQSIINALNTADATAFLTTASQTGIIVIKGFVVSGSGAGNITVRHLKVTSGTSTVKIGSIFKVRAA